MQQSILPILGTENSQKCPVSKFCYPTTSVSSLNSSSCSSTKVKPFVCGFNSCSASFGDPSSCARHRKETHRRMGAYRCPHPLCKSRYFTLHIYLTSFSDIMNLASSDVLRLLLISGNITSTSHMWI